MPLNVVGIIANVLGGMVTCGTILTSMCGGGSMEIWFTCNENGTESNLTNDFSPDVGAAGWRGTN